jgi:hypothetical protein
MPCMQLYRATALIAAVLIVVLSAGYAAAERTEQEQGLSRASFEKSGS